MVMGPTYGFGRSIAKEPFRAQVPGGDDALQGFADDGIIGRLDDRGKDGRSFMSWLRSPDISLQPL